MSFKKFFNHENEDTQVFLRLETAVEPILEVDMFAIEDTDYARVVLEKNYLEPLVYFRCKSYDDATFKQIEEALSTSEKLFAQVSNKSGTIQDLIQEVFYVVNEFYICVANLDCEEKRSEFRWMFTCFPKSD